MHHRENFDKRAKTLLKKHKWDFIFLDHDLEGRIFVPFDHENSGSGAARWIAENKKDISVSNPVIIHSMNKAGARNMEEILTKAKIPCQQKIMVWHEAVYSELMLSLSSG